MALNDWFGGGGHKIVGPAGSFNPWKRHGEIGFKKTIKPLNSVDRKKARDVFDKTKVGLSHVSQSKILKTAYSEYGSRFKNRLKDLLTEKSEIKELTPAQKRRNISDIRHDRLISEGKQLAVEGVGMVNSNSHKSASPTISRAGVSAGKVENRPQEGQIDRPMLKV